MDLQVAHAIAPDAQKVVVNARPTVEGDGGYEKIGQMLEATDRHFPGAVWSFSIGWGCDKLLTAADLAPVRSALAAAHVARHHGIQRQRRPRRPGMQRRTRLVVPAGPRRCRAGLGRVAARDDRRRWHHPVHRCERRDGWPNRPGSTCRCPKAPAAEYRRCSTVPNGSAGCSPDRDTGQRLTPDVAAVADPFTGVQIVFKQQQVVGGGTSQSAPIWAGLTAVMNQYLIANGGRAIGDLNPLLYRIAAGAMLPAFRDVTLGGNAVDTAGPGYDLVTGLGTPDVDNLVRIFSFCRRRPQ